MVEGLHRHLRWVETTGGLAVIIREAADGLLVRDADHHGGYHWVGRDVPRRLDCDGRAPAPAWLVRAASSLRPPRVLWPLLHDDQPPALPRHDFDTDADGRVRDGEDDGRPGPDRE